MGVDDEIESVRWILGEIITRLLHGWRQPEVVNTVKENCVIVQPGVSGCEKAARIGTF